MNNLSMENSKLFKHILERCTDMSEGGSRAKKHAGFYMNKGDSNSQNYGNRFDTNVSYRTGVTLSKGNINVVPNSSSMSRVGPNLTGFNRY